MKGVALTCAVLLAMSVISSCVPESGGVFTSAVDFRYWRCVMKRQGICPDGDVKYFLFSPKYRTRRRINLRQPDTLELAGWEPDKKNVIVIHGFNGTENKTPMNFIRDAYLDRGDFNVFTVDWSPLTVFPCYLSALANTKLVAQCAAQLYSHLTKAGALAKMTTCVGHSLGAHICGMMSNHLTEPQYKIIGLDPARPLVAQYGSRAFRLSTDDAKVVHVLHTNAGFLGDEGLIGHADFCINGGRTQPNCRGHDLRIARCSHFTSACYFAASVRRRLAPVAVPCDTSCPKVGRWLLRPNSKSIKLGDDMPDDARGMFCVKIVHDEECPFD